MSLRPPASPSHEDARSSRGDQHRQKAERERIGGKDNADVCRGEKPARDGAQRHPGQRPSRKKSKAGSPSVGGQDPAAAVYAAVMAAPTLPPKTAAARTSAQASPITTNSATAPADTRAALLMTSRADQRRSSRAQRWCPPPRNTPAPRRPRPRRTQREPVRCPWPLREAAARARSCDRRNAARRSPPSATGSSRTRAPCRSVTRAGAPAAAGCSTGGSW